MNGNWNVENIVYKAKVTQRPQKKHARDFVATRLCSFRSKRNNDAPVTCSVSAYGAEKTCTLRRILNGVQ